jgi:protein involved in polysaccharide export with SLBB domain
MVNKILSGLLFCVLLFASASAQIPNNLSLVKSSQISDAQLMQFIEKAQSSGMSEANIIADFQKRGLPQVELEDLASRLKALMNANTPAKDQTIAEESLNKRVYKGNQESENSKPNLSRIFGSELFNSADPLFVPNLRIATPKSYVIGPDDELQLDIFGNNISNQKLVVSPEGIVNVKYAGPVNISGMNIEQAAGVLKSRLTKFYPALGGGETKLQLTLGSMRSIQVMVIGAVKKPGTITLPSIATLFNALYSSGGPSDNGSFRNIELVRDNKTIAVADLYDFILKGDRTSNFSLRDNDVIRVPFAKVQVSLEGALNRTGIFEIKPNESLQQALEFAGGFLSNAFQGRITGSRYTDVEREVIDIAKEEFASFKLYNGDVLNVNTVTDKYQNRVIIRGAVSKPGDYSIEPGLDIKGLIAKSQGLADGAFLGRATLVRLKEDLSKEFVDIDLQKHLSGMQSIVLKKEDSLHVFYVQELKDKPVVTVNGAVRIEGQYLYEDSLTLQGLILKAGGLLENAYGSKIEIGRRKNGVDIQAANAKISEIIEVEVDKDLKKIGQDIFLQPYDQVSVRDDPGTIPQKWVMVSGQVLLPGSYIMESNADLVSVLISRCGGLLPIADINAVKLVRRNRGVEAQDVKRAALANLNSDTSVVNVEEISNLSEPTLEVAINLKKALNAPGSLADITLEEGDELVVPQINYVISVYGEVQKPLALQYEQNLNMQQYINLAGGYGVKAQKRGTFIVYPNGKSKKVKHTLGLFRSNPTVAPGSTVFVPRKEEKLNQGLDPAKAGIFVSAFTAIMTGLVLLFR